MRINATHATTVGVSKYHVCISAAQRNFTNSLCENNVNFGATFVCILVMSRPMKENVCMPYVLNILYTCDFC